MSYLRLEAVFRHCPRAPVNAMRTHVSMTTSMRSCSRPQINTQDPRIQLWSSTANLRRTVREKPRPRSVPAVDQRLFTAATGCNLSTSTHPRPPLYLQHSRSSPSSYCSTCRVDNIHIASPPHTVHLLLMTGPPRTTADEFGCRWSTTTAQTAIS